jgi:hypothetical protein
MMSSAIPDKVPNNGHSNRVHRDIRQHRDEILRSHITFNLGKLYITETNTIYNILPCATLVVFVAAGSYLICTDNLFSYPEERT